MDAWGYFIEHDTDLRIRCILGLKHSRQDTGANMSNYEDDDQTCEGTDDI